MGFKSNVVEHVALTLPTSSDAVNAHAPKGAAILQKDLSPPPGVSSINTTLAKFGDNLERLARLDRLSTAELSCYEAISGVYSSLHKIFEHEKDITKRSINATGIKPTMSQNERAEREVLCKKSGRPMMHAGRRVGLSLQYWMNKRLAPAGEGDSTSTGVGTTTSGGENTEYSDEANPQIWSATIECEASPAKLYPPIRVSENWVSEKITKSQDVENLFGASESKIIDWLEPSNTVMPIVSGQGDAMAIDSNTNTHKLPDIRFIAKLEPPIVVPLQIAVEIYATVGISIPPESFRPTTFDGLVVPADPNDALGQQTGVRELKRLKTVLIQGDNGDVVERRHRNTLYAQKQDFGRMIDEIPFSHPRQLIAILPVRTSLNHPTLLTSQKSDITFLQTLRQYALIARILHNSFPPNNSSNNNPSPAPQPTIPPKQTIEEELAALLSPTPQPPLQPLDPLPIDITLSTQPTPRISLIFQLNNQLTNLTFEISSNADIALVEQNVLDSNIMHDGGSKQISMQDLGRVLEISEDLGIVVEFLRRRLE